MRKKISNLFVAFLMLFSFFLAAPAPIASAASCDPNGTAFFSLKPWWAGLTDGSCNMKDPSSFASAGDSSGLATYIWTIVLNILYDISVIVGYIAVVMVAWGGYLYMFSRGMVDRAEKGKKTLIAAIIGLIITILASVIMNTISAVLIKGS